LKNIFSIPILITFLLSPTFPAFAQDKTAPPLVRQLYNGNWPSKKEAQELRDELYYQRAIHSYMTMQPAMNVIGMRDGSQAEFGYGYNVLPIWKDRMDSRAWVPTPNADVIYSMTYFDLKDTGPLVVAAPPKVIGMFTDFFQRTITDVGAIGPDRARGGLYLLLPPGYKGHIPAGYFTFESSTYNVFLFFRTVMTKGKDGPDPASAVATAEKTRIYPLWEVEKEILEMEFPNGSGKRINMMYPTDNTYWDKLKAFVDHEPYAAITPELRGVLASIGIVKDKPFEPTKREQELLKKAVETAPRMILALRRDPRNDKRDLYYNDRQYVRAWAGATSEFMQDSYLDVNQRAGFFQYAYSSAPAMVMRTINAGSKYPVAIRDADGDILNGAHTYKLHLPAGVPAKLFWAVTLYNITDGTMPETPQLMPSINSFDKFKANDDGSVDLYFGPTRPKGVGDKNWIQTVDGRDFLACIRLYGTEIEFFDQTWKPDDVVKLK
jgi:hypothetical protein